MSRGKIHVYYGSPIDGPQLGDQALCGHRKRKVNDTLPGFFTCKHCRAALRRALAQWRES